MTVPLGLETLVVQAPGVQRVSVVSERGIAGARGARIYSGAGFPSYDTDGLGNYWTLGDTDKDLAVDDLYINEANNRIYIWTNIPGTGWGWIETAAGANIKAMSSTQIDFNDSAIQTYTVSSTPATFTATGMVAGATVKLILTAGASGPYTVNWPSGWVWENNKPTSLISNQTAVIELVSTTTLESGVRATWTNQYINSASIPADLGLLAWNYDPAPNSSTTGTALGTNGTVYVMKLRTDVPIRVTNIVMWLVTVGATLTSGQNFAALYDQSKNLLAATADQTSAWTTGTGLKTMALTSPQTVQPGYFYVVLWSNGTTRPSWWRSTTIGVINGAATAANAKFATANTSVTTTAPASLGTFTAATTGYWVGVS